MLPVQPSRPRRPPSGRGLLGRLLRGLGGRLLGCSLFLGLAARTSLGLETSFLFCFLASAFLLGAEHGVSLGHHLADRLGDQSARADRVVVAGDHEVDAVGIAVGIDQAHHRDAKALGLFHRDDLRFEVDHEHRIRDTLHVLDATEVGFELRQIGLRGHALARR